MTDERPIGEDDLQAYVDERLARERRSAVETYLSENETVAARIAAQIRHREALRHRLQAKADEPIPARLRIAHIAAENRPSPWRRLSSPALAAGWVALGIAIGALGQGWIESRKSMPVRDTHAVAQDAITAYRTYVVETAHPVEVGAGQEAHLVQWLSRRLGKPIRAPDLTSLGYRLMGGRLLPAGESPAALFMYEDGKGNRLTVYARPGSPEEQTAFRFETQGDVSAFSWTDTNLSYVIAGRTGREKLLSVAEAVHRQVESREPNRANPL